MGRPLSQGVSVEAAYFEKMKSVAVPLDREGVAVVRDTVGVPVLTSPGLPVRVKSVPKCSATTKAGGECKARPTGSGLCVGHERQAVALLEVAGE